MTDKKKKKRRFLKLPEYPGGKTAFKKYIKENLRYPREALMNHIEGTVYLEYRTDDNGNVLDVTVSHGIGHGCDEEAIRLISTIKYGKVKNRGMRVTAKQKASIEFKLPKPNIKIQYNLKEKDAGSGKKPSMGYTIKIN
jgi:TonB family protein